MTNISKISRIFTTCHRYMTGMSTSKNVIKNSHETPISYSRLRNGEKIISIKNPGNLAHIIIDIKCGSRFESEKQRGISHLIRHTILGTNKYNTIISNTRGFFQIGADVSVESNRDSVLIRATVGNRYFFNSLDFIAACVSYPKFYYHETKYALQSCLIDYDNLQHNLLIENVLDNVHFQLFRTGYGNSLYVKSDCLSTIREYDLKEYYNLYVNSDRLTIGVISDFSHHFIEEMVSECFALPGHPVDKNIQHTNQLNDKKISVYGGQTLIHYENRYYHTALGYLAPSYFCPSWATFYVLQKLFGGNNTILTSTLSSSKFKKVFEKYSFQLSSFYMPYDRAGIFGFYLIAPRDGYKNSVVECFTALGKFLHEEITDAELKRAIAVAKCEYYQSIESPTKYLSESVNIFGGSEKQLDEDERAKAIDAVSIKDIKAALNTLIKTKPAMVSLGNDSYLPIFEDVCAMLEKP